jgi:hypothetical protein
MHLAKVTSARISRTIATVKEAPKGKGFNQIEGEQQSSRPSHGRCV